MKRVLLAAAAALSVLGTAAAANAAVTYDFIGPDYQLASGPFTTSEDISGTVTLATPLMENTSQFVAPISYTFADGFETFTGQNSVIHLDLVTNNSDNIAFFGLDVLSKTSFDQITATGNMETASTPLGEGNGFGPNSFQLQSVSAAPEPSTWALMMIGVAGLGLMLRRAKADGRRPLQTLAA